MIFKAFGLPKTTSTCQWPALLLGFLLVAVKFGTILKLKSFLDSLLNVCNRPHGLQIYLINVQTMRKISQIFVTF
jgi:hypothetical protein